MVAGDPTRVGGILTDSVPLSTDEELEMIERDGACGAGTTD